MAKNTSITSDFGFPAFTTSDIPDGSTINSVTIEIQYKSDTTGSANAVIGLQFNNNGTLLGTETTFGMSLTDTVVTKQTTTGITLADLQTANLVKARLRGARAASNTAITWSVDYVKVTVDYSAVTTVIPTGVSASGSVGTVVPQVVKVPTGVKAQPAAGIVRIGDFGSGTGTSYYVSATGSSGNSGTLASPWDLASVLNGTHTSTIQPGDIVWLRGGTYTGNFTSTLAGSSVSAIIVRAYQHERVTIDGTILVTGSNTWFWGLEVMSSDPPNSSNIGVNIKGPGCKLINSIVHDSGVSGVGMWNEAPNAEVYGCVIYNNGTHDNLDHGIYFNGNTGAKYVRNNVVFNNWTYGLHCYSTTAGELQNIHIAFNTVFNNGSIGGTTGHSPNILVGGSAINGMWVEYNCTWQPNDDDLTIWFNYGSGYQHGYVSYNIVGGWHEYNESLWTDLQLTGNTEWLWSSNPPTSGIWVFVRPNEYEPGYGMVTVYNWDDAANVDVDLSSILVSGDQYEIRDVQNYYGTPILSGTYSGGSVSVSMAAQTPPTPIGRSYITPDSTGTKFHAYVVVKIPTSPDATVTPTGVSATGSVGTVTPVITETPTGVSSTGSVGTGFVPQVTVVPTGVSTTGAVGSVQLLVQNPDVMIWVGSNSKVTTPLFSTTSDKTVVPTGVSATGGVGTVVPTVVKVPPGVAAIGQPGTVVPQVTKVPTGVEATGAVGTPTVSTQGNITVVPVGVSTTGSVGTVIPKVTKTPSGVSSTSGIGNVFLDIRLPDVMLWVGVDSKIVTPTYAPTPTDKVVPVTGVQATGDIGTVTVQSSNLADVMIRVGPNSKIVTPKLDTTKIVPVTGVQATGQVGNVIPVVTRVDITVLVTGVEAKGEVEGAIIYSDVDIYPDGVQAQAQVGQVTILLGGAVPVVGVEAQAQVGQVTVEIRKTVQGVEALGQLGQPSIISDVNITVQVQGVEAVGQIGQVQTGVIKTPTGVEAAGQVGDVMKEVRLGISGVEAQGQVGDVSFAVHKIVQVTGVEAVGQVGLIGIFAEPDHTIQVQGVDAQGQVGDVKVLISGTSVCFPTAWSCEPTPADAVVVDVAASASSWVDESDIAAPIVTEVDGCFTDVEY
jgi:hypothetical protein